MTGKKTNPARVPREATLLSKVSSLTLRTGKLTSARRISPVPQLECIGPKDVCKLYSIDVMRCTNEGADYDADNIQWSCKASLPEEFKLGSTDVICEGYESSDDPYVLKGSCGVEYRLMLTDKGEQKYGAIYDEDESSVNLKVDWTPAGLIFFMIFGIVLFIIVKGILSRWRETPPRIGGTRPNGGGGGDNDPPPPYDDPPSYFDRPRKQKTQQAGPRTAPSTRASSSRAAPQQAQQEGWRPGFWTGTAAGAAAGYYAASRGQTGSNTTQAERPRQPETQQRPGGFWSSLGGSQQPDAASSSSQSSSTSRNYSSTRHESTGFGETRRR